MVIKLRSISAAALVLLPALARAAAFQWTGTTDGNWTTGTNWLGGVPGGGADTALLFDSATQLTTNNDIAGGLVLNSLSFSANSGVRTLNGNKLTFDGTAPTISMQNTVGTSGNDNTVINAQIQMNQTLGITGGVDFSHQVVFGASAVFSGAGGLTWSGGLGFISASNTYSGATVIAGGGLGVSNSGAFGSSPTVTVQSGATLQLQGTPTINKPLSISGAGGSVSAALHASGSGSKTWTGTITLAADAKVGAQTSASLALNGTVSLGANNLTVDPDATSSVNIFGVISGAGGLTKTGSGVLSFTSGSNSVPVNTYAGPTLISAGKVLVQRNSAFGASSLITLAQGAEIEMRSRTNSLGNPTGGSSVSRPLLLGGKLSAGVPISGLDGFGQIWSGPVTLSGNATLSANTGGNLTTSILQMTGGVALGGFTLHLAPDPASSLNAVQISSGITGTGAVNIVTGSGRVILDGGSTGTFTGPVAVSGNLHLGPGDPFGNLANVVTFTGGSLVTFANQASLAARAFQVTGAGGLIFVPNNFASVIGANISGTGPVTFTGIGLGTGGVITLSGNNTFTGGMIVGSQTSVSYTSDQQLGSASESVTLTGGGLHALATNTFSAARSLVVTAQNGTLSAPDGVTLIVPTVVSGAGRLTLAGSAGGVPGGVIRLTGNNLHDGGIEVAGATLEVDSDSRIGAPGGVLNIGRPNGVNPLYGYLRALGSFTVAATRTTTFQNATVDTNGFDVTFDQPITGSEFIKEGAGILRLNTKNANNSTHSADLRAGTLRLGTNDALGLGANVTLSSGAVFHLNGFNHEVANISGEGSIQLGTGTLTMRNAGVLNSVISGPGAVTVKNGATPLFGGNNTFTGGLNVIGNARVLALSATAFGGAGNPITLDNGGLGVSSLAPVPVVIDNSTNLTIAAGGARFSAEGQTLVIASALGGSAPIRFSGGSKSSESNKYEVRLTNSANTFVGNVQLGDAQSFGDATIGIVANGSLGDSSNVVTLGSAFFDGETQRVSQGGLRAFADLTLPVSRAVRLNGSTSGSGDMGGSFDTNGFTVTVQGGITQLASGMPLEKYGSGTLLLNGTNTYTGQTTVREGTLGGTGVVGKVRILDGAALAPGASPGVFHTGDVTFSSSATLSLEFASPVLADQLDVSGTVSLEGDVQLALSLGYSVTGPDTFTVLLNDGTDPISGFFAVGAESLSEGESFVSGGATWAISYVGGTGNDVTLTVVPEPSAPLAMLSGLGLLLRLRLRRMAVR